MKAVLPDRDVLDHRFLGIRLPDARHYIAHLL